ILFALDARVVSALEGGPIVVKATLKYCGPRPITFDCATPENGWNPLVVGPPSWGARPMFGRFDVVMGSGHSVPDRCTVQPNGTLTEYLRVHRDYKNAPARAAIVKVTWSAIDVRTTADEGRVSNKATRPSPRKWNARLEKSIDVSVEANTPDALRRLCERLLGYLEKGAERADTSKM